MFKICQFVNMSLCRMSVEVTAESFDFVPEWIIFLFLSKSFLCYLLWFFVETTLALRFGFGKGHIGIWVHTGFTLFSILECHGATLVLLLYVGIVGQSFYLSLLVSDFHVGPVDYWNPWFYLVTLEGRLYLLKAWRSFWHLFGNTLVEIVVRTVAAILLED